MINQCFSLEKNRLDFTVKTKKNCTPIAERKGDFIINLHFIHCFRDRESQNTLYTLLNAIQLFKTHILEYTGLLDVARFIR